MTENTNAGEQTWRSRSKDVSELLERAEDYDSENYDEAIESLDECALSVETQRLVTVVLGTGGPHDELQIVVDSDGMVDGVTYVYYDWFGADRFERRLSPSDPLYQLAERYAEYASLDQ